MSAYKGFQVLSQGYEWPGGDCREVAIFSVAEEDVAKIFGRDLSHGEESGLGPWSALGFQLASGAIVELIQYLQAPVKGFIVRVDYAADACAAIHDVLDLLALTSSDLVWVHPDVDMSAG